MVENFTKKDLKDGMVVETLNNQRYLVVGDIIISNDGYINISDYKDNLTFSYDDPFNICKVYSKIYSLQDMSDPDILWERKLEKPVEMTIEEIQEILGYKIKIVS